MQMTPEQKDIIDKMSYAEMLSLWRFAPSDNTLFYQETGQYYSDIMEQKKSELNHGQAVMISKDIGWDRQA